MKKILLIIVLLPQMLSAQLSILPLPIGTGTITYTGPTFDPANKGTFFALSNNNLTASINSSSPNVAVATVGKSTGLWYWEIYPQTSINASCGIGDASINVNAGLGTDVHGVAYLASGNINYGGSIILTGLPAYVAGDVISFAWDATNDALYAAKNNTWINGGVPTSGASKTGAIKTTLSGTWFPAVGNVSVASTIFTGHFGSSHTYSPPSGYSPLN